MKLVFSFVFCFLLVSMELKSSGFEIYVMPSKHPAREVVDRIFQSCEIDSRESLCRAGFKLLKRNNKNNPYAVKHGMLEGYVVKLFTDDHPRVDKLEHLISRIEGANLVREIIRMHHYQCFFKVPRKWLYPLPEKEGSNEFILVVEDMNILSDKSNIAKWKSGSVSIKQLNALFTIVKEAGLYDSMYIENIPFSIDGKIAFTDTECFQKWPVPYVNLASSLSERNRVYWEAKMKK